jgi:hypothetical protein
VPVNWRWPATEGNYLLPWYRIGWSLLWFPAYLFFRVGLAVVYGVVSLSVGEGCRIWEETA